MLDKIKTFIRIFYKAGYNTVYDDGFEHAGYMTFITLLAIFPFLVFIVAIFGALGETQTGLNIMQTLLQDVPTHFREFIEPRINEIISGPPQGLLTIAILGTIWTASTAIEATRTVLNKAYRVHNPPAYIFRRLLSILQLLLLSVVMILAMLAFIFIPSYLTSALDFLAKYVNAEYIENFKGYILQDSPKTRYMIISTIIVLFISSLYYLLPNIKQSFIRTIPGAIITFGLWYLGSVILLTYLQNIDQINLVYGSLAGMIAFLLFIFVINFMFIFGAEFNYLLEKSLGHNIEEREHTK